MSKPKVDDTYRRAPNHLVIASSVGNPDMIVPWFRNFMNYLEAMQGVDRVVIVEILDGNKVSVGSTKDGREV